MNLCRTRSLPAVCITHACLNVCRVIKRLVRAIELSLNIDGLANRVHLQQRVKTRLEILLVKEHDITAYIRYRSTDHNDLHGIGNRSVVY